MRLSRIDFPPIRLRKRLVNKLLERNERLRSTLDGQVSLCELLASLEVIA